MGLFFYFLLSLTHSLAAMNLGRLPPGHFENNQTPRNTISDGESSPEDSPMQERIFETQTFGIEGNLTCGPSGRPVRGALAEVWDHSCCELLHHLPYCIIVSPPCF